MASTITIPSGIGEASTEVADNLARAGDEDVELANAIIAVATAAKTDVEALQAGTGVSGIIPAANVVQQVRAARGVVVANVADLAAFTVADSGGVNDGLTYSAGQIVWLVNQTTGSQDGPYTVGTVASTTAPLTRPAWWAAASVQPAGVMFTVNEGTYYKRSLWMATVAGAITVGTTAPAFYPKTYRQTVTLAAGTYKIGFGSTATPDEPLFLLSTTESTVNVTRDTAGGTLTGTVMYACPVTTRVAGKPGTANIVINSVIEAGTIQNQDTSTLSVLVTNW